MSVPLPASSPTSRILATLERERKEAADSRAAVWGFLWTLFAFKILTVGVIWWAATGTGESLAMIAATTWYWLIIPIGAIMGPLLVKWRLMKLRKKRLQLLRSEWEIAPEPDPQVHVLHVSTDPEQDGCRRDRA